MQAIQLSANLEHEVLLRVTVINTNNGKLFSLINILTT